ncbi:hypothetical protein WJX74_000391 [Apatococcus lobatus]|uniref:Acetolactate synthase large subunit n=1 Tax=Apatococcus lobatus TaxID=904363 RepID=A0AAW1QVF6_9CHLO
METISGAETLLLTLSTQDVRICFANPGTTEAHFMGAFDRVPSIRPVLCLHETVATGAADGFARLRQQPAMTLLHLGPGLANGLANLHNARRAGSAVLNVVGDMASWHSKYDPLLNTNIQQLATSVGATFTSVRSRKTVVPDTTNATRQLLVDSAHSRRCTPVVLTLPHDYGWELGPAACPARDVTSGPEADSGGSELGHYVEDCSEALCQAARFARGKAAILLGGSALLSAGGALQSAGQIAAATGCHLICENAFARLDRGRHLPCPERLAYFPQEAAAQLRKYTLILVIGMKRPIAMFGYRNGPSELLSLPDEAVWEFDNDSASPATLLKMLASSVASRQPWPAKYMDAVAQQPAKAPQAPSGKLTAQAMCTLVAQSQPEGTIMVDESLTSGTAYWEAAKVAASFSHLTLTGGAIGSGPPLALGAAIACPGQTVINLQADGSAMYSLQALWSQARENLKIITIICANQEYAILKVEMARQQALPTLQPGVAAQSRPSRLLTDIGTPRINWVSLAQGMGLQLATRATSCEEFREQMAAALAHDGPSLIEAVLK